MMVEEGFTSVLGEAVCAREPSQPPAPAANRSHRLSMVCRLDNLDNPKIVTEALKLANTRFRAISFLQEIIVEVYKDGPNDKDGVHAGLLVTRSLRVMGKKGYECTLVQ